MYGVDLGLKWRLGRVNVNMGLWEWVYRYECRDGEGVYVGMA